MTYDWPVPSNAVWEFHFKPTDITGATKVKFDFYVETAANLKINSFELGSHKNSDWKEKTFNNNAGFGGIVDGWNTITLTLAESGESNDTNPNDGSVSGWDPKTFQRIRMYNVDHAGAATKLAIKNIVAVKADGSEIKIGAEPAPDVTPTIKVLSAEWNGEHDWTITFKATGLNHPDFKGDAWVGVYPSEHTSNSYSSADSMQTWRYLNEGRAAPTDALNYAEDYTMTVTYTFETNLGNADGCAPKEDGEYDLVLFFNDSGYDYVCRDSFKFNAEPEQPDEPTPATFDAVSSVAVAAVAALGVALVASKKRH